MRDITSDEEELQGLLDQHVEDDGTWYFPGDPENAIPEMWQWDERDPLLCGTSRIQERRMEDGRIEQRNKWRPDEGENGPWTPWYPSTEGGSFKRP